MVRKLASRSPLSVAEQGVLLGLPHHAMQLQRGRYLAREGERSETCAVLLSGFAFRNKTTSDGARQILSVLLRGDLLDLQNCLLSVADHSVQALTSIHVAYVPHQALLTAASSYPAIGRALWQDSLIDASILREWTLNVGRRDARQRISHLLCEMAIRQEGVGLCSGPEYDWPMTQGEIGDASGLTTVHVNRTLQGLRGDGLISTDKGKIAILDWDGLQAEGDFTPTYLHQPSAAISEMHPSVRDSASPMLTGQEKLRVRTFSP